jgi:hypothetical protein
MFNTDLGRWACCVHHLTPNGDGRRPQRRVGREHAMVAMAMPPGRRDQCRELLDRLQWRERRRRGAIALGLGQAIDDALGIDQFQTLEREQRAGTVAQQSLQTGAFVRAHAHRGIQREATALPGEYVADVITLHQPAAGEPAHYAHAHWFGDDGDGLRCQVSGGANAHGLRVITGILDRLEDPVHDAAVIILDPAVDGFALHARV